MPLLQNSGGIFISVGVEHRPVKEKSFHVCCRFTYGSDELELEETVVGETAYLNVTYYFFFISDITGLPCCKITSHILGIYLHHFKENRCLYTILQMMNRHYFSKLSLVLPVFILLAGMSYTAHGQPEYSKWLFGYGAGLDFAGGNPTYLAGNSITTDEGGASIADNNGNLLFYTNGEVVMNRLHQQMSNGIGLGGHFSSTQSALIVPFPGDDSLYYVFTVPAQVIYNTGTNSGLCYSVVDLRLDNFLGDVVLKNVLLKDSSMEKLSATRHANGRDVWVVMHEWNSDAYYSFLVTCDGIQAPVISHAGRVMTDSVLASYHSALGCMQISPDGKRIAATWDVFNQSYEGTTNTDILEFSNITGVISNPVYITHQNAGDDIRGYGVCFSAFSQKFYLSIYGLDNGISFGRVLQYDLMSSNIPASEVDVAFDYDAFGTMQLAPDGMIYIAREGFLTYLSRIQFPEAAGAACGFQYSGVSLVNPSTWGLPNNWDHSLPQEPYEIFPFDDSTLCENENLELHATYRYPYFFPTYQWSNGSNDSVIVVDDDGTYWVNVIFSCDTISDTVIIHITNLDVDIGNDTIVCNTSSLILDAGVLGASYLWSNGATTMQTIINQFPQSVSVTVTLNGCTAYDEIMIGNDCGLYIPNIFTPNNDGLNDLFKVIAIGVTSFNMKLFNRWGHLVFATSDLNAGWDGTYKSHEQELGTYVFLIEAILSSGNKEVYKGAFILAR